MQTTNFTPVPFSDAELRELRDLLKTDEGQRAIRHEIRRHRFEVLRLRARRMVLHVFSAPRGGIESTEADAHSVITPQIILYVLTGVALLAGLVRILRQP